MKPHIVKDGNAFYEIDDDCVRRKAEKRREQERDEKSAGKGKEGRLPRQ